MDNPLKTDILLAMALAYAAILAFRMWPRIQAKLLGVPFISAQHLKNRMDDLDKDDQLLIIDVRLAYEFNGDLGHIPGALNLELAKLHEKLDALGDQLDAYKDEAIVVVCRTSKRSPKAARILFQHGFRNISILKGGMQEWNL